MLWPHAQRHTCTTYLFSCHLSDALSTHPRVGCSSLIREGGRVLRTTFPRSYYVLLISPALLGTSPVLPKPRKPRSELLSRVAARDDPSSMRVASVHTPLIGEPFVRASPLKGSIVWAQLPPTTVRSATIRLPRVAAWPHRNRRNRAVLPLLRSDLPRQFQPSPFYP